jgi:peptidoglycan-associated lipoprotein
MIKNITLAFCTIFLLSGCAGKKTHNQQTAYEKTSVAQEEIALSDDFTKNVGDRVFFAFDKSDVSEESRAQLQSQATWLKKHSNVSIIIEGHCDERGTREYNLALGERRASSVRNFLVADGIEDSRIETISYGKERPALECQTEEAFKQNRRAVTIIK